MQKDKYNAKSIRSEEPCLVIDSGGKLVDE